MALTRDVSGLIMANDSARREPPLFSVVTPSYNQARFLEGTLRSVRRQNYPRVEHWVIDGGSDDGTVDLLRRFEEETREDENYELRWISEPDRGQSHAVNKGFDRVEGDFVGWLNSDDMYPFEDTLGTVVEAFGSVNVEILYGDNLLVDPDNRLLRVDHKHPFSRSRLLCSCFLCQPALFFRAEVLEDRRLDESLEYVMDYEFWLRLSEDVDFQRVGQLLAADRNHPERKMIINRDKLIPERRAVQRAHGQEFGLPYRIGRACDRSLSVWYRLRGLFTGLAVVDDPGLTFDLHFDSPRAFARRQLFARNRDLV